jgi:hypothetical protein
MIANFKTLLSAYAGWPVLLDSNLLLLHWCAALDLGLLKTFKRLQGFTLDDVAILAEVLAGLGGVKTTPHVLTEVSNLANALPSWKKSAWTNLFAQQIQVLDEIWQPAQTILEDRAMGVFGLTDAALGRLAGSHLILSVDWPLCNYLAARGLATVNFHLLRHSVQPQ